MLTGYVLGAFAGRVTRVPLVIASRRGLVSYREYPARWRMAARVANRMIDFHLCNSNAVRDWAIQREALPPSKVAVIYNGLDSSATVNPASERDDSRPASVRAAMIANFLGYKGHRVAIQALSRIKNQHPEFCVVFFGKGPELSQCEEMAAALGISGQVVFAGSRPEAAKLLPQFDFSILSSFEEGFPNAIMESMAAGIPVIATRVGGVPELVTDTIEGLIVPPRDAEAMAGALTWMIEHPVERRLMGAFGRLRIAQSFSVAKMVRATERVYLDRLPMKHRLIADLLGQN